MHQKSESSAGRQEHMTEQNISESHQGDCAGIWIILVYISRLTIIIAGILYECLQQLIFIDVIEVNVQSFSPSFPLVVFTDAVDEASGVCSATSSVMNSSSSYFLYLIQNTTVCTASTMAGAAQIHTRFGSLIAGVIISPRAEERAVVKRKSDLGCVLDRASSRE